MRNTHDMDLDHHGTAVAEQIATGTATAGYLPVSTGVGAAPVWTAVSGGGLADLITGDDSTFASSLGAWTASGGTFTRDTTTHLASFVASAEHVTTATNQHIDLPISGTFSTGVQYEAILLLRPSTANYTMAFGLVGTDAASGTQHFASSSDFIALCLFWTPTADRTGVTLRIGPDASSATYRIGWAKGFQTPVPLLLAESLTASLYTPVVINSSQNVNLGSHGSGLASKGDGGYLYENMDGSGGLDVFADGELYLYGGTAPAGDLNQSGLDIEVGPDYVGLYISEKDSSTIQLYDDASGSYDIEMVDQGSRHFKHVDAAGNASIPALGRLRVLSAAPGSPTEGDSYYDSTLHKSRTWDGSAWQNWW